MPAVRCVQYILALRVCLLFGRQRIFTEKILWIKYKHAPTCSRLDFHVLFPFHRTKTISAYHPCGCVIHFDFKQNTGWSRLPIHMHQSCTNWCGHAQTWFSPLRAAVQKILRIEASFQRAIKIECCSFNLRVKIFLFIRNRGYVRYCNNERLDILALALNTFIASEQHWHE